MKPAKKKTELTKKQFLARNYSVRLEFDNDEHEPGWFATCEELRGLNGWGLTPSKAVEHLEKNRAQWYDDAIEHGIPIPLPAREVEEKFSGKFLLRVPPQVHALLVETARERNLSLNQLCESVLRAAVK